MSDTIIKIENLGKKYQIGSKESYYSLRDQIADLWDFKKKKNSEDFWALKDVNFEIKRGEAVGIIGRNGAGKSTLLKILSQITPPTTGKITMRGRVASLLEVGTGFHQELTGRENIFLNGAILGLCREEIRRKFDEIVAFAEIDKFLDTPVKRYSSGMYVRLAFAIAAHLEPEILIVDEVLAVGDAQFQKKCLGKMDDVSKKEGRTVLFVTHNLSIINQLCPKTIFLEGGQIKSAGKTSEIVGLYLSSKEYKGLNEYAGNFKDVVFNNVTYSLDENFVKLSIDGTYIGEITQEIRIGVSIINQDGVRLTTFHTKEVPLSCGNEFIVNYKFPNIFHNGVYSLEVGANTKSLSKWCRISDAGVINVNNKGNERFNKGLIMFPSVVNSIDIK